MTPRFTKKIIFIRKKFFTVRITKVDSARKEVGNGPTKSRRRTSDSKRTFINGMIHGVVGVFSLGGPIVLHITTSTTVSISFGLWLPSPFLFKSNQYLLTLSLHPGHTWLDLMLNTSPPIRNISFLLLDPCPLSSPNSS